MAESLLFRKGTLEGLSNASLMAGAVSFTTDEPAIYLDIQEGESVVRKRIGDLIVYNTLEELKDGEQSYVDGALVSNWSSSALYYIVERNALLKWIPQDKAVNDKWGWVQINSVSELEGNLSALTARVSTAEGKITTLETTVGQHGVTLTNHEDRLDDLEGWKGELITEIGEPVSGDEPATGLYALIAANAFEISALKSVVGDDVDGLVADVAKNASDISTLSSTHATDKATLEQAIADGDSSTLASAKSETEKQVSAAKTELTAAIATAKSEAIAEANNHTNTEIGEVNEKITELETADTNLNKAIADGDSATLISANSYTDEEIGKVNTTLTNLKAGYTGTLADLNKAIADGDAAIQSNINTLSGTVESLTTTVETNKTNIEKALAQEIQDRKDADTALEDAYKAADDVVRQEFAAADTALKTAITGGSSSTLSSIDGQISAINGNISTLQTDVSELESEAADIRSDFAAADTALENKLTKQIDDKMAAADAMTFKGVVSKVSELPSPTDSNSEAVQAGWTYKVSKEFTASNIINTDAAIIRAGDLLIASDDLTADSVVGEDFWYHIPSGYELDEDPILTGSSSDADAEIIMKSHTGDDRGSVKFVGATGQNIVISSVSTVDDPQTGDMSTTVTVGLNWVDF